MVSVSVRTEGCVESSGQVEQQTCFDEIILSFFRSRSFFCLLLKASFSLWSLLHLFSSAVLLSITIRLHLPASQCTLPPTWQSGSCVQACVCACLFSQLGAAVGRDVLWGNEGRYAVCSAWKSISSSPPLSFVSFKFPYFFKQNVPFAFFTPFVYLKVFFNPVFLYIPMILSDAPVIILRFFLVSGRYFYGWCGFLPRGAYPDGWHSYWLDKMYLKIKKFLHLRPSSCSRLICKSSLA